MDFGKIVDTLFDWCSDSVGFFKWSPALAENPTQRAEDSAARDDRDAPYEEVLRETIFAAPADFGFEDITGTPWVEIDFTEDVLRAKMKILPLIDRGIQ